MPTYQYACTECGHDFEAVQSFSDDSLTECPQCQGRLRKVFGSVGVVFKGSGFYRNDSRDAKPKNGESKVGEDRRQVRRCQVRREVRPRATASSRPPPGGTSSGKDSGSSSGGSSSGGKSSGSSASSTAGSAA